MMNASVNETVQQALDERLAASIHLSVYWASDAMHASSMSKATFAPIERVVHWAVRVTVNRSVNQAVRHEPNHFGLPLYLNRADALTNEPLSEAVSQAVYWAVYLASSEPRLGSVLELAIRIVDARVDRAIAVRQRPGGAPWSGALATPHPGLNLYLGAVG